MSIGKLFDPFSGELIGDVDYQLKGESDTGWWGELVFTEFKRIGDTGSYLIELDDSRRGKCYLKKRVNRAVTGVPPRYIYHFAGTGPLDET